MILLSSILHSTHAAQAPLEADKIKHFINQETNRLQIAPSLSSTVEHSSAAGLKALIASQEKELQAVTVGLEALIASAAGLKALIASAPGLEAALIASQEFVAVSKELQAATATAKAQKDNPVKASWGLFQPTDQDAKTLHQINSYLSSHNYIALKEMLPKISHLQLAYTILSMNIFVSNPDLLSETEIKDLLRSASFFADSKHTPIDEKKYLGDSLIYISSEKKMPLPLAIASRE